VQERAWLQPVDAPVDWRSRVRRRYSPARSCQCSSNSRCQSTLRGGWQDDRPSAASTASRYECLLQLTSSPNSTEIHRGTYQTTFMQRSTVYDWKHKTKQQGNRVDFHEWYSAGHPAIGRFLQATIGIRKYRALNDRVARAVGAYVMSALKCLCIFVRLGTCR